MPNVHEAHIISLYNPIVLQRSEMSDLQFDITSAMIYQDL